MPRSLRSPKLVKRHRRKLAIKLFLIFFLLSVVVAVPIFLSRAPFLTIQSITVFGNTVVSQSDLVAEASSSIQGEWLWVFKKSNSIIYPRQTIENNIMNHFSRIESVKVSVDSFKEMKIEVSERKPEFLWCRQLDSKECFFMDSFGLIFARSPDFSSNVYVVYTGRIEGDPLGQNYLASNSFDKTKNLISGLVPLGLAARTVSFIEGDSYKVSLTQGGDIIVSLSDDISKVLSNLESVLSDPTLNLLHGNTLKVASIDLRYGNKVILKKQKE